MSDIVIQEKPDWISFDDIHNLLYIAHENNRNMGFHVDTAEKTGAELEEYLGKTGKCYVALDGKRLVGTESYRIEQRKYWCAKGKFVNRVLVGVHPDYQGQHISTMLYKEIERFARENGYKYLETRTAENNKIIRSMSKKNGFYPIDFISRKTDHYTVIMIKWLGQRPVSNYRIFWHFIWRKALIKLRYKPGKIKRFGI